MATIVQRGESWQVKVRATGQPVRSKTFRTREEAEAWAAAESTPASGVTVGDLFKMYVKRVAPSRRNGDWERRVLQRLLRAEAKLCSLGAASLGKHHLATWRDRRLQEVAPASLRRELDVISAVYVVAIAEWNVGLAENPVHGFRRPALPLPREVRLTEGDDGKLIAAAIDFNREIAPAIILAIETGMRQGEIASLRWENIDVEKRTALLPMTKNGTRRRVPLSSKALEALTWCPPPHRGRVFKLTQHAMKYAFQQVREQCGLEGIRFHDLRHEAISRFFEKGLNVMEVAAISGHKNLKMLQRYTHLDASKLAAKLG
ncbi:site-specific integrase/recombinase [Cupriavidus basilensis OR16]|uniref:Site-specific integrase/recombinase n=1 Tax=Cupriavidus basilensis OR16 TaxID=1127483 RepID=H1SD56_9BURK|nr:site-specific integrase [Cupriavidus basilensis]EHP39554.1 site-specific integrase/recombinase [Cupriavidus basilensis OR16]